MDIGGFLKFKRQARGLTQKEVADAVGVSEGTVSRWESGKIGNMRRDKIEALAKILDMDPTIITRGKYAAIFESNNGIATSNASAGITAGPAADSTDASAAALFGSAVAGGTEADSAALAGLGTAAAGAASSSAALFGGGVSVAAAPFMAAATALAGVASELSKLIEDSPNVNRSLPTEFNEDERQLITDYRTLSDSDKQTIQIMIRSLKEKNTIASSDAIPEEG